MDETQWFFNPLAQKWILESTWKRQLFIQLFYKQNPYMLDLYSKIEFNKTPKIHLI